jgi:chromosome segregation ATPase|tara:strand:- start:15 stop:503 length:489 start_codon:yes stop_codon:yes gene_type:complete
MKRDVNLGLLILIIVSIVLFSGFSVYYETSFKDVSLEYQEKLEQLSQVTKELVTKRQELNETYSLRVKAEQDKQTLDARYNEVRGENDQLSTDNTNLRSEVINIKSDLAEKSAQLDVTRNLLAQTQSQLSSAEAERDKYRSRWDTVCDAYTSLNGGVEHDKC